MNSIAFFHNLTGRRKTIPISILSVLILGTILAPVPARAAPVPGPAIETNRAVLDFPETVSFELTASHSATIERIVLEYGVDRLACGEVTAKAYPEFEPGERVETSWVWYMRQSGSEPPGTRIWWQWRITDAKGDETLVGREEILWLDSVHDWELISENGIRIHWYAGGREFGEAMSASAVQSVRRIDELIDLQPDAEIDIFLYGSYEDLWESILNEPGWAGGISFGEYNIIILGVLPGDEEWGKTAIAHELMHTMVDRFTFSCLVRIPSWIHEGLATVSEGGPDETEMSLLQKAIERNTIFPLRSLGGGFPEDEALARLAYVQSYSVVDFLLQRADAARMRSLLEALGGGTTTDDALQALYGFNIDGLDAAWRESVGAEVLTAEDLAPTATSTYVPTYAPLSVAGANLASGETPTPSVGAPPGDTLPPAQVFFLLCACCAGVAFTIFFAIIFILIVSARILRR